MSCASAFPPQVRARAGGRVEGCNRSSACGTSHGGRRMTAPSCLSEAADCLAAFGGDPAGLVVACRRLLAHHSTSATLWWLCAQVLAAPDAVDASWSAWQAFTDDATPGRLVSALPFPHDDPVAVLGWPDVVAAGLSERPDLDVVAVRARDGGDQLSRRLRRSQLPVRVVERDRAAHHRAVAPPHRDRRRGRRQRARARSARSTSPPRPGRTAPRSGSSPE